MAEESTPRSRRNEDGSLDVWVQGWRIHFEDDCKPTTSPEQEVPSGTAIGAADLQWWADEGGIWIRFSTWYVQIRDGQPRVMPASPRASGSGTYALRLYRRRVD